MLRINLLPPYIHDKSKKGMVLAAWGVGLAAVAAGLLFWFSNVNSQLADEKKLEAEAKTQQDIYNKRVSSIDGVKKEIADTQAKQTFIASSQTYNQAWPETYEMMRDLTSADILLKNMTIDATKKRVDFAGFATNELAIVRWWSVLRNNTTVFDQVFFNLPRHEYDPRSGASVTTTAGGGGNGGFGGGGGRGAPTMAGSGGMAAMMMGGGMGGGGGARAGGAGGDVGPTEIEGKSGLNFTAFATLKKALADGMPAPSWPPGSGGTARGGGGMGMGGMSGMSGMMGAGGGSASMGGMGAKGGRGAE